MKVILIFLMLGFLSGVLYGICKFINVLFNYNTIILIITDIIFSIISGFSFTNAINFYFFGKIRLYIVVIFLLGLYLERKTLGKLFAKLYFILYNVGRKSMERFSSTKLGKIIFK